MTRCKHGSRIHKQQRAVSGASAPPRAPTHDEGEAAAFQALVREGQEMRRAFDAKTAKMRIITPDDLKVRSR